MRENWNRKFSLFAVISWWNNESVLNVVYLQAFQTSHFHWYPCRGANTNTNEWPCDQVVVSPHSSSESCWSVGLLQLWGTVYVVLLRTFVKIKSCIFRTILFVTVQCLKSVHILYFCSFGLPKVLIQTVVMRAKQHRCKNWFVSGLFSYRKQFFYFLFWTFFFT